MSKPASRYKLRVSITMEREENFNPDQPHSHWTHTQDRLNVSEDITLGALDFMGVCGVLGELHEAVTAIADAAAGTCAGGC